MTEHTKTPKTKMPEKIAINIWCNGRITLYEDNTKLGTTSDVVEIFPHYEDKEWQKKFANDLVDRYNSHDKLVEALHVMTALCSLKYGNSDELIYAEDVVIRPTKPRPFKIIPLHSIPFRKLIEDIAPFEHSNPDQFLLMKLISISSYISKIFICISSNSNFTSDSITSPVLSHEIVAIDPSCCITL